MRRSKNLWAGALLMSVLVAGCGGNAENPTPAAGEGAHAEEDQAEQHHGVVLEEEAIAIAGIEVEIVETVQGSGLPVTGTITYDANRVSHIGPRIEGRIVRLAADVGSRVDGGDVIAVLESPVVGDVRAAEAEAEALVAIANENYQRELRLEEQGISSRKELLDAEAALRRTEASLASARQRLRVLGASGGRGGEHVLNAPFPGTVVDRQASLGEMAGPADQLFTVANLDQLWIELDIYERDLSRVFSGQPVEVTTTAYPGQTFPAQIGYVGDIVDPDTRTVRARVEIPNPGGLLKPGMFADALIQVSGGGAEMTVIPRDAVQQVEGGDAVFVPGEGPGEFHVQPVVLGEGVGDGRVVVQSGLAPGDRVVTVGAFILRSELEEAAIGEAGHSH